MRRLVMLFSAVIACVGCHSTAPSVTPLATVAVPEAVSRDSAQFVAVLDTLKSGRLASVMLRVGEEPTGLDRLGDSKAERKALSGRVAAMRRSILTAKGISVLREVSAGKCPAIMTDEKPGSRCPKVNETRVTVSVAKALGALSPWGHPPLAKDETVMDVYTLTIGPGGYSDRSDEYVLKQVDGKWKVVRIVNSYIM